jgi:ATP-dependent protease ClpP protease subunit
MNQLICKIPSRLMASFSDEALPVQYLVSDDSVDIFLHGIVGDEYTQTDSLSVAQLLASTKGKAVNLRVNSPGGLAYDGVAMYNAIDSHDGPTTGIIEGMAGSAASLAVIACDTVKCYSTAVFHPHYSLIMAMGHQADIREALAIQEVLDSDLETVYSEASGQSLQQVKKDLMGANGDGTRMNAEAALSAGYVDEIIGHKKQKQAASTGNLQASLALRQRKLRALMAKTS